MFWSTYFISLRLVCTYLCKDELKSTDPFGSVDLPVGGKSTDPQSGWMDDDGRVLVHHRPSIYWPIYWPSMDGRGSMDDDGWWWMVDGGWWWMMMIIVHFNYFISSSPLLITSLSCLNIPNICNANDISLTESCVHHIAMQQLNDMRQCAQKNQGQ